MTTSELEWNVSASLIDSIRAAAWSKLKQMTEFRRAFHRHPELGFQEEWTSGVIGDELERLGYDVVRAIARTGLAATLDGRSSQPHVVLRFDMDALPMAETSGADYASEVDGVAHACGHDGHLAIGLGVAEILVEHRNEISGPVTLLFQPAEELLQGAQAMLHAGIFEMIKPEVVFGMHLWNGRKLGWIGGTSGAQTAGGDSFRISISGRGGHGASPHEALDPVIAAAHVVTAMQTVVSRNLDAMEAGVISVTTIHGGDTFNVIPSTVELGGTIRTYSETVRGLILGRLEGLVSNVAAGFGCEAQITFTRLTKPVVNTPLLSTRVLSLARTMFPDAVVDDDFRTMASEDFSHLAADRDSAYFYVGSADTSRGLDAPHHDPRFDFDERALAYGAALMSALAIAPPTARP